MQSRWLRRCCWAPLAAPSAPELLEFFEPKQCAEHAGSHPNPHADPHAGTHTRSSTLSADYAQLAGLETKMRGWGQGVQVDDQNRPLGSTDYQGKYGKYDAFFIMPQEGNHIYLTFDQGYENGYTAPILDTLKEKDVSAVFFLTLDYAKRNPELIKRMIDEGHVLGNHSASHKNYPELPIEKAHDDAVNATNTSRKITAMI